jgi:hypothetical protein
VTGVAKKLPADVSIKHLLPCVKELVTDSSQHARGTWNYHFTPRRAAHALTLALALIVFTQLPSLL